MEAVRQELKNQTPICRTHTRCSHARWSCSGKRSDLSSSNWPSRRARPSLPGSRRPPWGRKVSSFRAACTTLRMSPLDRTPGSSRTGWWPPASILPPTVRTPCGGRRRHWSTNARRTCGRFSSCSATPNLNRRRGTSASRSMTPWRSPSRSRSEPGTAARQAAFAGGRLLTVMMLRGYYRPGAARRRSLRIAVAHLFDVCSQATYVSRETSIQI